MHHERLSHFIQLESARFYKTTIWYALIIQENVTFSLRPRRRKTNCCPPCFENVGVAYYATRKWSTDINTGCMICSPYSCKRACLTQSRSHQLFSISASLYFSLYTNACQLVRWHWYVRNHWKSRKYKVKYKIIIKCVAAHIVRHKEKMLQIQCLWSTLCSATNL